MISFHKTVKAICPLVLTSIAAASSLTGCSVQRSAQYYWPTVTQTFPRKPDTVRLPIYNEKEVPKQRHIVIGTMSFQTDTDEMESLYKKLQYNARRNGGDAVILKLTHSNVPNSTEIHVDAKIIVFR